MIQRHLRIVFLGTPDFAVPSLEILYEAGYHIVGVITAPDKPGGRGMKQMMISSVKSYALSKSLNVLQPSNLKSNSFLKDLKSLKADLQVVVAFRMLPEAVWNMPPLGTINLHGSLLPAYRGAAPIQWAIIHGEKITGLTTFKLQHEIDEGQIIAQKIIPIPDSDNAGILHDRMMMAGAGLVLGSVDLLQENCASFTLQESGMASFAPKINHENTHIHWSGKSEEIRNLIRGLSPFPGAWTSLDGLELKIFKTAFFNSEKLGNPGTIRLEGKKLIVQTQDGNIEIEEVQLTGKRKMKTQEFLNGYKIRVWNMT